MYTPKHFDEPRVDVLHELMRRRPLATLVTLGPKGVEATHIPLHLAAEPGPFGTLRGHVSRLNSVWREADQTIESLAIFTGPDTYISPSWYPAKKETGRVVPTWNYVVAHARVRLGVVEDRDWLRAHLEALTGQMEHGRAEPWRVEDAPAEFVARLLEGLVGLEMPITRLEGKWKVSQNQTAANRTGVISGLLDGGGGDTESSEMARLVADRAPSV
jgi:transcriptional regulator